VEVSHIPRFLNSRICRDHVPFSHCQQLQNPNATVGGRGITEIMFRGGKCKDDGNVDFVRPGLDAWQVRSSWSFDYSFSNETMNV